MREDLAQLIERLANSNLEPLAKADIILALVQGYDESTSILKIEDIATELEAWGDLIIKAGHNFHEYISLRKRSIASRDIRTWWSF